MSAMPAEARALARTTLGVGLRELKTQMKSVSRDMYGFLVQEAERSFLGYQELEDSYAPDVKLAMDSMQLVDAGYEPEEYPEVRSKHIGFRMCCAIWDVPAGW